MFTPPPALPGLPFGAIGITRPGLAISEDDPEGEYDASSWRFDPIAEEILSSKECPMAFLAPLEGEL
jgi:hypothetical protein